MNSKIFDTVYLQHDERMFYERIINELDVVIDIGAQESFFQLLDAEVHFFEPDPAWYDQLVSTATPSVPDSIDTKKQYFFNNVGIGSTPGTMVLYAKLGSTIYREPFKDISRNDDIKFHTTEIDIITLQSYIKLHNISKISLLKIDCEGMEFDILNGMGEYINICKYIVFEYDGSVKEWNDTKPNMVIKKISKLLSKYTICKINDDGTVAPIDIETYIFNKNDNFVAIIDYYESQ